MSESSLPASLQREGRAMLGALIMDLLAIPDCQVATTLDSRIQQSAPLPDSSKLEVEYVQGTSIEQEAFNRLCAESDGVFVIAPETGGELHRRVDRALSLGSYVHNCSLRGIDLCADKLRLAEHLRNEGIATIPTRLADLNEEPWDELQQDCVVKPRDGAGSWLTFRIPHGDSATWRNTRQKMKDAGIGEHAIIQPFVAGTALSVGCLCNDSGDVQVLPIALQNLRGDGFQYLGGVIPASIDREVIPAIHQLVQSACLSIDGLRGYVGVDLLLPETDSRVPIIVEVNPRLTTSYVGYRHLCKDNIAARMVLSSRASGPLEPLAWRHGHVTFDADGRCQYRP